MPFAAVFFLRVSGPLLAYKCLRQGHVTMLRGNHEDVELNARDGFKKVCHSHPPSNRLE